MRKLIMKSILAGMCVSFGVIAYGLAKNEGILGASLFSIGILLVIEFDFKLFTSYVPKYAPLGVEESKVKTYLKYIRNCLLVCFFNFCGAAAVAGIVHLTRISELTVGSYGTFTNVMDSVVATKLADGYLSVFLMSIFCGIIIACICKADKWKRNIGYIVILIITFVICGFDHVVANSFYLVYTGELWTSAGIVYFLISLIGNFIGGYLFMLVPLLGVDEAPHYLEDKLKKQEEEKKKQEEEKKLLN